jgi:catechol 2,3-dioxygenase-like lactoylglutathione lyase family enzyme
MLDHVGINCSDLPTAAALYDKALGALGYTRLMDFGEAIGYGADKPDFWIGRQPAEGPASGPNREIHVAFGAKDAAAVRAFFDAAVSQGAEVLHEPRFWPEYHEGYYGVLGRGAGATARGAPGGETPEPWGGAPHGAVGHRRGR